MLGGMEELLTPLSGIWAGIAIWSSAEQSVLVAWPPQYGSEGEGMARFYTIEIATILSWHPRIPKTTA